MWSCTTISHLKKQGFLEERLIPGLEQVMKRKSTDCLVIKDSKMATKTTWVSRSDSKRLALAKGWINFNEDKKCSEWIPFNRDHKWYFRVNWSPSETNRKPIYYLKKKKKAFRLLILHELQQLVTRWSVREASLYSIISANKRRAEFHALKKAPE